MKKLHLTALAIAMALTGVAAAQREDHDHDHDRYNPSYVRDRDDWRGAQAWTLKQDERIVRDLRLDRERMRQFHELVRRTDDNLRGMPRNGEAQRRRLEGVAIDYHRDLWRILSPDQEDRYMDAWARDISHHHDWLEWPINASRRTLRDLRLSRDQWDQVNDLNRDVNRRLSDAWRDADGDARSHRDQGELQNRFERLNSDYRRDLLRILDRGQGVKLQMELRRFEERRSFDDRLRDAWFRSM